MGAVRNPGAEPGGVEVIERAVELLRTSPGTLGLYAIGACPFAAGLLYFTGEMSHSAFAADSLGPWSLVLALLFVWKQVWQSVFCSRLHEKLSDEPAPWTMGRVARIVALQAAVQPTSLVLLPVAMLATLPFPWCLAFYRNLTVFTGIRDMGAFDLALRNSTRWPRQNVSALLLLSLLALLVYLNCLLAVLFLPPLAKSVFGLETLASRFTWWWLNTSVMMAVLLLAYTLLDPLFDAVYVVRCFLGESRADGQDLRVRLRRFLGNAPLAAAIVVFALMLVPGAARGQDRAQAPPVSAEPATINGDELSKKIDEVLRRREFSWRNPQGREERRKSKMESWIDSAIRQITMFFEWMWKVLRELFREESNEGGSAGPARPGGLRLAEKWLLMGLVGIIGAAIGVIVWRQRRALRRKVVAATAVEAQPQVDITDEGVTADKLPEDSWLSMARELASKGDFRLALRAQYLATLSMLSSRGLVSIQRWKSGVEYTSEIRRRSHSVPAMPGNFSRNLLLFEMGWYGRHPVTVEVLDQFAARFLEMKNDGIQS